MKYNEWLKIQHDNMGQAILCCYNKRVLGAWNENNITKEILSASLGPKGDQVWDNFHQHVHWETCKLVSEEEEKYGDIALWVKVRLAKDVYVDGVAFYEAKRMVYHADNRSPSYSAFDENQLQVLHNSVNHTQILLYQVHSGDNNSIQGTVDAVPLSFVLAQKIANYVPHRNLSLQGEPWIMTLGRHLRGFNLDSRPEALNAFRAAQKRYAFVINAGVSLSPKLDPVLEEGWFDPLQYKPLDSTDTNASNKNRISL